MDTHTPVLEAVGDQLSFGQVVEPRQLPAAVPAGVERREALVAPLQLHRGERKSAPGGRERYYAYLFKKYLGRQREGAGLLERPGPGAEHLDTEVHCKTERERTHGTPSGGQRIVPHA